MWLKVYNHDLGCKLFNSTRFVLSIPDTLLTFCFTLVSRDMQISYQMVSNAHVRQLTVSL